MPLSMDCKAWNRGFWDGEEGKPLRTCPYAVGTTERWSWSSGFIEGNAFRNGAKATLPCSLRQVPGGRLLAGAQIAAAIEREMMEVG